MIEAKIEPNFSSWRTAARSLLRQNIEPENIFWHDGSSESLPIFSQPSDVASKPSVNVPKKFVQLAQTVSMHRDPSRWSLLYRILFRLTHEQVKLLEISVDDDVHQLLAMEKSVRRDLHKMHAFVRFRKVECDGEEHYIAFHRPDHLIMPAAAPWFAQRFPIMRWTILTPDASATWDLKSLRFGPGVAASPVNEDEWESLWQTYYSSIFNPARVKIRAMKKEMPVRHWQTLPETQMIDDLLRKAPGRVSEMIRPAETAVSAATFVPKTTELAVLQQAARSCKGCDLYCNATQTVFGRGPANAIVMFVGEQPGDQEDLAGEPFVGPAGQVFDEAMREVGIERDQCYVTNAVKHFRFDLRGKRRIHSKPSARHVSACKPWLEAEVNIVKPQMIVALGATAAQAIMGPQIKITQHHGRIFTNCPWTPWFMATIHPSALLRIPDPQLREQSRRDFFDDLRIAANHMQAMSAAS